MANTNLTEDSDFSKVIEILEICKKEFQNLPRSLGYDFTHIPKLNEVLEIYKNNQKKIKKSQNEVAQYWWDHLTRRQQLFLKYISVKYGIENKDSYIGKTIQEYWYEYSLNNDIHKLVGWPETTESDLRKI